MPFSHSQRAHSHVCSHGHSHGASTPAFPYVRIPLRLAQQALYRPHLIGIYGLIARLWRLSGEPVALSVDDLRLYDPTLVASTTQRALTWLVTAGWLVATKQRGHKTLYTPTWGRIKQEIVPWQSGVPSLGRPGHVRSIALDVRLFDVYMGRLIPYAGQQAAKISRYLSGPALALTDIGSYVQIQLGLNVVATPALMRGDLVRDGMAITLPHDEATIIAHLSQQTLFDTASPTILPAGLRRAGLAPATPMVDGQPTLFFVEPTITEQIIDQITQNLVTESPSDNAHSSSIESALSEGDDTHHMLRWNRWNRQEQNTPPVGGGTSTHKKQLGASEEILTASPTYKILEAAKVGHFPSLYYVKSGIPHNVVLQAIHQAGASKKGPGYISFLLKDWLATGKLPPTSTTLGEQPWSDADKQRYQQEYGMVIGDTVPLAAPRWSPPTEPPRSTCQSSSTVSEPVAPMILSPAIVLHTLVLGCSLALQHALKRARMNVEDTVVHIHAHPDDYALVLPERAALLQRLAPLGVTLVQVRRK